jgi:hypothetical protein
MEPVSTRTPEGEPTRCPVCGTEAAVVPSTFPIHDVPCPACGHLLVLSPGVVREIERRVASGELGKKMERAMKEVGELVSEARARAEEAWAKAEYDREHAALCLEEITEQVAWRDEAGR